MTSRRFYLALVIVIWIGLGCSLPSMILTSPTSTPVEPLPLADEPLPPEPTDTIEPPPATPTLALPTETVVVDIPLPHFPIGFIVTTGDGSVVTFYTLDGQPIGSAQTPGMSLGPATTIHVAGPFSGTLEDLPLIFKTYDNNGDIKQSLNNEITTLFSGPDMSYLRGVPGKYALIFTTVTWGENLTSYLYARTAAGSGASWFWDHVDPRGTAIYPLAVEGDNQEIHSVIYTLRPWGIGGDIVFPPQAGLSKLNIQNMSEELILTEDFNPIGLSPDNRIVAYTQENNVVQDPNTRITIYDLTTTTMVPINLASGSERGAGYAVFSPDNQYVAWMEASGWMMAETPNFHSRVRIADMDGKVLADIPDSAFASVAADPTALWVTPVGWLDGETLLVQVGGDLSNSPLVKVRYDGTGMSFLASGKFLDFLYP